MFFSLIRLGLYVFGEEYHHGKMPFSLYYLKDIYHQHGLPVVMPLVIRLLISFLHHRVTLLPSLSVLFSLEGSYYSQIYFSSGESCSTSLMVKHFQQLFGILLTKTFVFSSVVIHLSVSVRMHRYMFYTLHLYLNSLIFLLLKLFQLWPLNLSMDSCVPLILIHLIILYMCIYLFTYLYGSCWGVGGVAILYGTRGSRLSLYISCPSSRFFCHFSKEAWFPLSENAIRNQHLSD